MSLHSIMYNFHNYIEACIYILKTENYLTYSKKMKTQTSNYPLCNDFF